MSGDYGVAGCGRSTAEVDRSRRLSKLLAIALATVAIFLAIASHASALTLGVGWTEPGYTIPEMPQVAHSGAQLFRVPLPPSNVGSNDLIVAAAARNHVTIEANIGGGGPFLPAEGTARNTFKAELKAEVERYGYGGVFWEQNPALPYEPITAWEIWNEPNKEDEGVLIPPALYGIYLSEMANTVQSASESKGGRRTEVLSGGLLALGNLGGTKGNWAERGPSSYQGALKYLEEAIPFFGSNVTGVAIHPYELEESTFYTPPGEGRYNRIQAFEYAVKGFRATLSHLGSSLPLWITEAGWPAEGPKAPPPVEKEKEFAKATEYAVGATEQANLLKASINFAHNNDVTLGLAAFLWYNLRDVPAEGNWAFYCGLRDHEGNYRPSWYVFQEETGAGPWPTAPTVETGEAQVISETGATLHANVNPEGAATSYRFEYGTTDAYGHSVPIPSGSAGGGDEAVAVSQTITNLRAHTHYHYRVVATNTYGNAYGTDRTFTTGLKWVIRNSNSGGGGDASYWFGLPGQIPVTGDWDGNGTETPGTYEPSTGIWRLRNNNTTGSPEIEFQFGGPAFRPVVGDWDGNGTTTIGLYEPTAGEWRLKNSNGGGNPDVSFQFGGSQFAPVVGDWDGNGTTTVGLYEATGGNWALKNTNSAGNGDISVQFGGPAFKPVTGDWDGNGTTTIGLYEPSGGNWALKNTNSAGNPDVSFQFGGSQFAPVVGDWDGNGTTTVGLLDGDAPTELEWLGLETNFNASSQIAVSGDWNGDGISTPGTYEPSTGIWRLRNSDSTGAPEIEFQFGGPAFRPVVGDWDGNGTTTVGLYEPSGGNWALKNTNSAGNADISFQFGGSQFTPVTGDWDGNGTTTVGLYEATGGNWALRNSNSAGNADISFQFGGSQFTPVTGDWDGNGTTTVGLYEATGGNWVLKNSNSGGNGDLGFQFGGSQFTPVVGDWDGNGTTTVGLYEGKQGRWGLRNSNSGGNPDLDFSFAGPTRVAFAFSYQWPGQIPVTGDWDGNGTETPGTYEPSTGIWRLRNSDSTGAPEIEFQFGGSQFTPVVGDWDGNGTTTVGLYEATGGNWALKNTNSAGNGDISVQFGGPAFKPVTGDWDGNGTTTIGLYEPSGGNWALKNTNSAGNPDVSFQFGGSQFAPVVGDWDGNGTTTVGLYEATAGEWRLKNTNSAGNPDISFQFGGPEFTPLGADWDGNGTTTVGLVSN